MVPFYRTIELDLAGNNTTHVNYNFFKKHVRAITISTESGDTENFESERLLKGGDGWIEKSETQFRKDIGTREIR